jgi:hypothetical protein
MRPWETAGWRSLPFFYLLPAAALRLGAYIIDTGQPCHTDVSIVCAFYAELVGEAWGRMPLLDNRWRGFMGCPDGLPIECLVCRRSLLQNSRWSGHKALTYHHKMRMTPIEIIFLRWLHCFSRISGEITNSGQEGQNHYN